jgi:dihydrofolate reductase
MPRLDPAQRRRRTGVTQALSRLGLIDEYRLIILPVALGHGLPLFKDLAKPLRVDLAGTKSFPDGTVINVYRPAGPAG